MYTSFLIGPHNTAITHDEKTGLSTRPYQDNLVQILLTENKIELIKSKINSSMHELKETNKPIFDKYLFKATAIISLYILITIFLNPNLLLFLLLIILEPYYLIKSTTNSLKKLKRKKTLNTLIMYLTYELNQTEAKLLKLKQDSSNSFNRTPGETTNISSQNNILKKELEKDLDFIVEYLSCVYQNEINENNETLTAQEKRLIRTLNEEIL